MDKTESRLFKFINYIPASYKFFEDDLEQLLTSQKSLLSELNVIYNTSKQLANNQVSLDDFKKVLETITLMEILPIGIWEYDAEVTDVEKQMIYSSTVKQFDQDEIQDLAIFVYDSLVASEKVVSKMINQCGKPSSQPNYPPVLDVFTQPAKQDSSAPQNE